LPRRYGRCDMLPGRERNGRFVRAGASGVSRILGTRTAWTTVSDGEFFCPGCGGDRNYQRLTGRRRFTCFGVPVLPRGEAGPVVECAACRHHYSADVLGHPTTTRFSAFLRDAVHTVALAVLAADGSCARAALETAACAVRSAGFDDCSEEQLAALVEALAADTGRVLGEPCGPGLAIELHEALDPLAPHLAPTGREAILLQGARIALADGPYTPAERETLATVGVALTICADDVTRLLTAARTSS
jgi:hypothetical protein